MIHQDKSTDVCVLKPGIYLDESDSKKMSRFRIRENTTALVIEQTNDVTVVLLIDSKLIITNIDNCIFEV